MSSTDASPALILIVDDSEAVRREVITALQEFRVVEACDGRQGAELVETLDDLSLVICDVNMPNLNGIEMLERIQGRAANPSVPIVMLTTEGQPALIRRAKELGAKGWIVKPFDPGQLCAAARKLTTATRLASVVAT